VVAVVWRVRQRAHHGFDFVDDVIGCRRTRRDPDDRRAPEPLGADIGAGLHVKDARAEPTAGRHQLAGVVAARAADHDDDIGLSGQLFGRLLSETRGQTHGVHQVDRRPWEALLDERGNPLDALGGLRGLRGDTEARPLLKTVDVLVREHDVERGQVLGQAAHLRMSGLSDDHRMAAVGDEHRDSLVGRAHERTRGIHHRETARPNLPESSLRRSMCGDHHGCRHDAVDVRARQDAARSQFSQDGLVVHEIAKDRQRFALGRLVRLGDRPPHPEAHTHVTRPRDLHDVSSPTPIHFTLPRKASSHAAATAATPDCAYRAFVCFTICSSSEM
jgi:hypothetical protein